MRRVLLAAAGLLLCGSLSPALAQNLPQIQTRGVDGGVRELAGAVEAQTWRAVGRLDTGASFCTATLIASDLVLTAAHCLFHPTTNRPFAASELTFLAGLRNGQAEAMRGARRLMIVPGYDPVQGADFDMIGRDLALVQLAQPISGATIPPIATGPNTLGDREVTIVSYGTEREEFASIEEGCEILERQGNVRALSCHVVSGSSGSPVLRISQGRGEVIGVISATGTTGDEDISLAVMLNGHFNNLMETYRDAGSQPILGAATGATIGAETGSAIRFIGAGSDRRGDLGARFIRP